MLLFSGCASSSYSVHGLMGLMTSPNFGYLSRSQRAALIEANMLTVVPPGRSPDVDRLAVRRALLDLPWAWEPCADSSDGLVDRSRYGLVYLEDMSLLARTRRP